MKALALQILLGISLAAVLFLSISSFRSLYLIASAIPEETVYFRQPVSGFIRSVCVALWPLALYLVLFIFAREFAWSRFGRVVFAFQLVYVAILICQWIYVYRLSIAFNRNA